MDSKNKPAGYVSNSEESNPINGVYVRKINVPKFLDALMEFGCATSGYSSANVDGESVIGYMPNNSECRILLFKAFYTAHGHHYGDNDSDYSTS
jgi:hypothetical protein